MNDIAFNTESGTTYKIVDLVDNEHGSSEEETKQLFRYSGRITRTADKPLIHVKSGEGMDSVEGENCVFHELPVIGKSFWYYAEKHDVCISTPVETILTD
jgi:hypothetical protein